jgi:hypothetical protein
MSGVFPTPPWQSAAGITSFTDSASNKKTGGRFIPDISGMVGYTGYVINGMPYNLAGTSAVAPLYAGLFASIRSALNNRKLGLLNPTVYQLGQLGMGNAFHDVKFGNNDSVLAPDSPFFSAGVGYDPTTGWGSIDGTKMMAAIGKTLFPPVPPLGPGNVIVGVILGGVNVDGGGSIVLPGGHVVPIDPWTGRTLAQVVRIAEASEELKGVAKAYVVGDMYKELGKITNEAAKALEDEVSEPRGPTL